MAKIVNKKWSLLDSVSGVVLGIMLFLTLTLAPVINSVATQSGNTLSAMIESP